VFGVLCYYIFYLEKKKSTFGSPRWEIRPSRANLGFKNDFISLTIDPHARHLYLQIHTSTKTHCNQSFSLQTLPPPPLVTNSLYALQRLSLLLPRASDVCILPGPTGTKDTVPQPTYVSRIPRRKMLNELLARTDHDCGTNTRWMGYGWVCWI